MIKKIISIIMILIIISLSFNTSIAFADNRFFTTEGGGGGGGDAVGFTLAGTLSLLISLITGNKKAQLDFTYEEIKNIELDLFVTNEPAGMVLANKLSKSLYRKDDLNRSYFMDKNEGIIHDLDNYMIKPDTKIIVSSDDLKYIEKKIVEIKNIFNVSEEPVTIYQKWINYPESIKKTFEYPYQVIIYENPNYTYLYMSKSPLYYNTSIKILENIGDNNDLIVMTKFYNNQWEIKTNSSPYFMFLQNPIFKESNVDIFTDSTLSLIYFNKTIENKLVENYIIPGSKMGDNDVVVNSKKLVNIDNITDNISFKLTTDVIDEFGTKSLVNINTDDVISALEKSEARARVKGNAVIQNITLDQTNIKEYEESLVALQQMQDGIQNNFNTTWDNFDLSFNPPQYILDGMSFVSYIFTQIWNGFGDYIIIITFALTIGAVILLVTGILTRRKDDD